MDKGWLDEQTFKCFVPAKMMVVKGGEKGAAKDGKRWIQGIASTDAKDLQGEVVAPGGIDFSYFLKHGFFNDDHKPGPESKVGQPTEAKLTKNGLWVKGYLFKNESTTEKSAADKYWDLMNNLEASNSDRKVGFSIEGKVIRRNGTTIEKCWIKDIAITTQPVNSATWVEIAKSLAAQKWDLEKEDKKKEEETDKAMSASGSPLIPQSLDSKVKNVTTVKSFDFDEACVITKSRTGLTDDEAIKSIVRIAFGLFSKE